jgi:hypothetical protein
MENIPEAVMSEGYSIVLLVSALLTLVFGGLGLVFFLIYLSAKRKADASRAWPSTTGMIETSTITSSTHTDSDGFSSTSFAPVIVYSYSVMGSDFHSRRVGFGMDMSGPKSGAVSMMKRYPVGKTVSVFFDPEKPGEAVLEHSIKNSVSTIILFSVFGGVGIIAFLVSAWIMLSGRLVLK